MICTGKLRRRVAVLKPMKKSRLASVLFCFVFCRKADMQVKKGRRERKAGGKGRGNRRISLGGRDNVTEDFCPKRTQLLGTWPE